MPSTTEESFGNASMRCEEHCGWCAGRTSILRLVESVAGEAETFVEAKLDEGQWRDVRMGLARPLAELEPTCGRSPAT